MENSQGDDLRQTKIYHGWRIGVWGMGGGVIRDICGMHKFPR